MVAKADVVLINSDSLNAEIDDIARDYWDSWDDFVEESAAFRAAPPSIAAAADTLPGQEITF